MHCLLEQLSRWAAHTSLEDRTKVRLVGHQPHRARLAYLHTLFPALSGYELGALEDLIQRKLPPMLNRFYTATNGIRLFESQVSVNGLVTALDRDPTAPQPICLETDNLAFPGLYPEWSRQGYFAIGAISFMRQDKLICGPNDHIVLLDAVHGEPQREFSDVFDCLVNLTNELGPFWTDEAHFIGDWDEMDRLIMQRSGSA